MVEELVPMTPEERDASAAELALGIFDGEERATVLRRLMADRDFSPSMIGTWEQRLSGLFDAYMPVTPPDTVWVGIEARLRDAEQRAASSPQLRWWRGGALVSGAIALSLAAVMLLRPTPPVDRPTVQPVAMARMSGAPDGPVILARYDPVTGGLTVRPTGVRTAALVPELWIIPADGKPRSLGLIAAQNESRIVVDRSRRAFITEGATFAVSLETKAGAPHDAPSSVPIAAGEIALF